jgi:hypothetical protein
MQRISQVTPSRPTDERIAALLKHIDTHHREPCEHLATRACYECRRNRAEDLLDAAEDALSDLAARLERVEQLRQAWAIQTKWAQADKASEAVVLLRCLESLDRALGEKRE